MGDHFQPSFLNVLTNMIFLFLKFLISKPIHLTDDNFTDFIQSADQPVFLKLWATWCPHCKEFAPIWDELSLLPDYEGKVYIADIECEMNRDSCKNYPGDNYPRLYWIDSVNKTTLTYTGNRDLAHFQMFIKKQLHFPLILINQTELDEYTTTANLTSVFAFKIPSEDTEALKLALLIAYQFRDTQIRFVLIENANPVKSEVIAYSGMNHIQIFNQQWNEENLNNFVIRNSVPYLSQMDPYVMRHFLLKNITTFAKVTRDPKPYENTTKDILDICLSVSELFPVTQTSCFEAAPFCRYVDIDLDTPHEQFVLYNRATQIYWSNPVPFDENENKYDKEAILNWVNDVLLNRIPPKGPGAGMFKTIKQLYYKQKAQGNPIYVILVPPILLVCLTFYMIHECFTQEKPKND